MIIWIELKDVRAKKDINQTSLPSLKTDTKWAEWLFKFVLRDPSDEVGMMFRKIHESIPHYPWCIICLSY